MTDGLPPQRATEHWLDTFAKRLAGRASRRETLARAGVGLLGGVLAAMLPRRAEAFLQGQPCGAGGACPPGETCIAGLCLGLIPASVCQQGLHPCGNRCVNLLLDPNNCGGCNIQCPFGIQCIFGACTEEVASSPCSNTISDPNNCGACGHVCQAPAGTTATCTAGVCGFVCAPGFKPCNGTCIPAGNCCTALDCPAGPPSATVSCTLGQCGFTCPRQEDGVPEGIAAQITAGTALADAARLPATDGEPLPVLNSSCCINSDCLGINGTVIFPVARTTARPADSFFCGELGECVCMNGTCFAIPG